MFLDGAMHCGSEMEIQNLDWAAELINQIRDESTPPPSHAHHKASSCSHRGIMRTPSAFVFEKIGNPAACERLGAWNL